MSTSQLWELDLPTSSRQFMQEIIKQVPEEGGARYAFVAVLNSIAKPSKEIQRKLDKLQALENGGVDNWEWYGQSLEDAGFFDEDFEDAGFFDEETEDDNDDN